MSDSSSTSQRPPSKRDPRERNSHEEERALSMRDIFSVLRRRWYVPAASLLIVAGLGLLLHSRFPPWIEASVYLKLGEEWGRAVQSEKQTLDEAFSTHRSDLAEQLMRDINVGPKPKQPLGEEEVDRSSPTKTSPSIEWDLREANLDRCELPPLIPRRIVLFGKGRTRENAVAFLEYVSDRIVADHQQVAERYREKWRGKLKTSEGELERMSSVRRNISDIVPSGEREKALQVAALGLVEDVVGNLQKDREDALTHLKLKGDSMTCRTGTPAVLGPVGARSWALVLIIGSAAGFLFGSVVCFIPEISAGLKKGSTPSDDLKENSDQVAQNRGSSSKQSESPSKGK